MKPGGYKLFPLDKTLKNLLNSLHQHQVHQDTFIRTVCEKVIILSNCPSHKRTDGSTSCTKIHSFERYVTAYHLGCRWHHRRHRMTRFLLEVAYWNCLIGKSTGLPAGILRLPVRHFLPFFPLYFVSSEKVSRWTPYGMSFSNHLISRQTCRRGNSNQADPLYQYRWRYCLHNKHFPPKQYSLILWSTF